MRLFELRHISDNFVVNRGKVYENGKVEIYYSIVPTGRGRPVARLSDVKAYSEGSSSLNIDNFRKSIPRHIVFYWV